MRPRSGNHLVQQADACQSQGHHFSCPPVKFPSARIIDGPSLVRCLWRAQLKSLLKVIEIVATLASSGRDCSRVVGHCHELGFGRDAKCTLTAAPRVACSLRTSSRGTPATSLGCGSRRAFRIHVFDECVSLTRPIRLVRHVGASSIRLVRSGLNQPTCQNMTTNANNNDTLTMQTLVCACRRNANI